MQARKDRARAEMEAKKLKEDEEARRIDEAFAKLNRDLDPEQETPPSRVRRLARDWIFGTNAEPRAPRTAKMNMIMHGDGHGGIHYHDGLVDINGVFPGRFDIVLTNPPFGQNVGDYQKFGSSEQTRVPKETAYERHCRDPFGDPWRESHARTVAMAEAKTKILDNFAIGKDNPNRRPRSFSLNAASTFGALAAAWGSCFRTEISITRRFRDYAAGQRARRDFSLL